MQPRSTTMTKVGLVLIGAVAVAAIHSPRHVPPTSVPDGFTFVAGGDLLGPYHTLQGIDDSAFFKKVVPLFKNADVGFANQEGSIFDLATFQGWRAPENGGGTPLAPPAVARDLKAMGITMVSKANNHATDWGDAGLIATMQSLTAAGIAFAGSGVSDSAARAPAYIDTPKGRVAVVSTASTFPPMSPAGPPGVYRGLSARARPGISVLHVQNIQLVSGDQVKTLRAIAYGDSDQRHASDNQVEVGDQIFRAADKPGITWEMNKTDEAAIINSVRDARERASFVLFTIHAHETAGPTEDPGLGTPVERSDEAQSPNDPVPADFEPRLFHEAIDAGADAVVRTGPHLLNGIEIYKGKPIFYCLGSLFFDFGGRRSITVSTGQTINLPDEWFETVVPVTTYQGGRVSEIKLYPMILESSKAPTGGAPHPADPEQARRILERLKTLSAAFGTKISIENNIGIIRAPAA
jgi:poly-gamma-glutamate capsule biosynthesis protein CapA/YwtB (metallophosphatase superfamily)